MVERNPEPPAIQTRSASIATKHTTLSAILEMGINVDDVMVPGFQGDLSRRPLKEFAEAGLLDEILRGVHDPVPQDDRHESNFFNAGVKALENTVSVLRGVEGRIKAYQVALERCKQALADVRKSAAEAHRRLAEIDDEVAEARHDVSVARTLLAEEERRIDAINSRRKRVLQEQTPFLVYRRPRVAQSVVQTPARTVDPAFSQPPVVACLGRSAATPPELEHLILLMRRAPVAWFAQLAPLIERIDRPQSLLLTMQAAKLSALAAPALSQAAPFAASQGSVASASGSSKVGLAIRTLLTSRQNSVTALQARTASIDLSALAGLSWQNSRDRAKEVVTVGDLIDGANGKNGVASKAAAALDEIEQVAGCLYEAMSEVQPILRLAWAELLSQFDAPVSLRNLASLPRWGEIEDLLQRRELQALVDWLYAQVTPQFSDAVDLVNDLVRVCILLASHAPVNQIIAGAVREAVTARPGGRVQIEVESAAVRVGMPVYLYRNQQVVAQAVVDDLVGNLASARFVQVSQSSLQIDQGARAHFGELTALRRG
ncbi:MAG: hypothetical protein HC802_16915 [Caldilineaceae bacterium]|nr:hypothetical protein [Caldilineaceae bacterium]